MLPTAGGPTQDLTACSPPPASSPHWADGPWCSWRSTASPRSCLGRELPALQCPTGRPVRQRDRSADPGHRPHPPVYGTHAHELLGKRVLGGGGGTITRLATGDAA